MKLLEKEKFDKIPAFNWEKFPVEFFQKMKSFEEIFDFPLATRMSGVKEFNINSSGEKLKRITEKNCKNIIISFDLLNYFVESKRLNDFLMIAPNANITIELDSVEAAQDVKNLLVANDELKKVNKNLFIVSKYETSRDYKILYEIDDIVFANKQLDDWANEINSAVVYGNHLSPLEKFVYAYMIVTNREYKENKGNRSLSRNVVAILNGDYCVCAGFASLLEELCSRIGIRCVQKSITVGGWHAINAVIIDDEKYGIENSLYYSDPTYDCKTQGNTMFNILLPSMKDLFSAYHDVEKEKCKEFSFDEKKLFYDEISYTQACNNAKKIHYNTMVKALLNVFESKGLTSQDCAKYLNSTFDKVKAHSSVYKDTWAYDFLKAKNVIKSGENNNSPNRR